MSKPMVEKYQQILAQDPTSTVFVELAKALIEQGEHQRALEICQQGLEHHRRSVVGRVLWGKALIHLGRPAEAMEQFDQAVSLEKDNPHAYNLIGEVLLHQGLYRSALPLLRKAVALQPNDARVRQWLEQTQSALAGGPTPVLTGKSELDPKDPAALAEEGSPSRGSLEDPAENTDEILVPSPSPETSDPFAAVSSSSDSAEILRGLTSTFDALSEEAPPDSDPEDLMVTAPVTLPETSAPTVIFSPELLAEQPPQASQTPARRPPAPAPPRGLLDEVPEMEPSQALELPVVEVSRQATLAIAKEYERELREELEEVASQKSFLQRHGLKLALLAILGCALAVGGGFYLLGSRQRAQLEEAVAQAQKKIAEDTLPSYRAALESLSRASRLEPKDLRPAGLSAYVHAVLFAEHGQDPQEKEQASAALAREGVREKFPGLALASAFFLSSGKEREPAAKAVLGSTLDEAEVRELSGRILLSQKKTAEAIKQLSRSTELNPAHVRALVALGSYYLEFGDYEQALRVYSGAAATVSKLHPERAIGAAEARLALGREAELSLPELEALPSGEALPPPLRPRRELALGRLRSLGGRHEEAKALLEAGRETYPQRAFEFQLALGEVNRNAGEMGAAERAYEAALKAKPSSEEAKEGLGRVLIARDRESEVPGRVSGEGRKLSLVRGMALVRMGDWRRARAELSRTEVGGKFPAEAVVYLALLDAKEGQAGRAQKILEKALAASKRGKSEVRIALGNLYWEQGALDKAKALLEEAAKDPLEYEGACAYGRLLLQLGVPEAALAPLSQSIARNRSHSEAHRALAAAAYSLGKVELALQDAEAFVADSPLSLPAQKAHAQALYRAGRAQEALSPAEKAVKLGPGDAEAHRLRALALFGTADGEQAFLELERANKLDSKNPSTFCEIGLGFLRVGNAPMASSAFAAALRSEEKNACARVGEHLARLPRAQKGAAKELEELGERATLSWERSLALSTLARLHLAQGAREAAGKAAERAVELNPASGLAQLSLGLWAAQEKDQAKARQALESAAQLEPLHSGARLALADALASGEGAELERAAREYQAFLAIGGEKSEIARVKKLLPSLRKRQGQR